MFKLRHYKWICLLLKLQKEQVHFSLGSNLWHAIKCSLTKKSVSIPKELKLKNKVSGFGESVWFSSSRGALSSLSGWQVWALTQLARVKGICYTSLPQWHTSTNLPQLDRPTTRGSSRYSSLHWSRGDSLRDQIKWQTQNRNAFCTKRPSCFSFSEEEVK